MVSANSTPNERNLLDFFHIIELGDSLYPLLHFYRTHPDLINAHHPITQLRPIDYACMMGRIPIVDVLITLGADHTAPNTKNNQKFPVHYAAANGRQNIVQFLVAKGADPAVLDGDSQSIQDHAQRSKDQDCIAVCENQIDLLPLPKQINWKNPEFIQHAFSCLKNLAFLARCPDVLKTSCFEEDDILAWSCLDDNPEIFGHFMESDDIDFKYLQLALAFNRTLIAGFFIRTLFGTINEDRIRTPNKKLLTSQQVSSFFECAVFSGNWINIFQLRSCLAASEINKLVTFLEPTDFAKILCESLQYSINSDSLELFTRLLEMSDVKAEFESSYLLCLKAAIRTRNNIIFQRILQLAQPLLFKLDRNVYLQILNDLLLCAVANGNLLILDIILSLDSTLNIKDSAYAEIAIRFGHCSLLDRIFSANSDILLKHPYTDTIPLAIRSGSLAMLDKLLQYYGSRQAIQEVVPLDELTVINWLKQALHSENIAMVLRVLTLNPALKIDFSSDELTKVDSNVLESSTNVARTSEIRRRFQILRICQQNSSHTALSIRLKDNQAVVQSTHETDQIKQVFYSKSFIYDPPILVDNKTLNRDVWGNIIDYLHYIEHGRSLAQTSRFFKSAVPVRRTNMSENILRLCPLLTRNCTWQNPYFIMAVYNRLQNPVFIKYFDHYLQFYLFNHDNITVMCILDDNVEQFIYHNNQSILEYGPEYLELAIAFGRTQMANYLLQFQGELDSEELHHLMQMAWLSGLPDMVDLVLRLISNVYPLHQILLTLNDYNKGG